MSMINKIARGLRNPGTLPAYCNAKTIDYRIKINNAFVGRRTPPKPPVTGLAALDEIQARALVRTDINDHLVTLFIESLSAAPKLIVELGVRGGETAFVLERVASLCGSRVVLVDIEDCSGVTSCASSTFVKSDDVELGKRFPAWCRERGWESQIDILHIDTSHLFAHTMQEIEHWFPHLGARSKVFLHDTNLTPVFRRRDGSMGKAWNNERGVIRALERYFDKPFDETRDFIDYSRGWLIKHDAVCNGFTILERIELPSQA